MQNLVSNLTQFSNYQIFFLVISFAIFFISTIITAVMDKNIQFLSATFTILTVIGMIILFIFFMGEQSNAVKNHEYKAIRNEQTLEIESKNDMIKSHKFKIDSEDHDHIYIKTSSLFGTTNYIIDKSEIDKNIINVN